jgi:hypothetical protein
MWSLPIGGAGGGLGAALVGLVDVLGFPVCSFVDVPQATTDNAMAPVSTRIAAQGSRGWGEVVDINVSPITAFARASGYPL